MRAAAIVLTTAAVGREPRGARRRNVPETMTTTGSVPIQLNPLTMVEEWDGEAGITADDLLKFLCRPHSDGDPKSLLRRYRELDERGGPQLYCVPAEDRILEKLVWPLKYAKAAYMTGNDLAAIALCGTVAEMVANLHWQLARVQIMGRVMSDEDEGHLLGMNFEKLRQGRRVDVLKAYGVIDRTDNENFKTIAGHRNKYMHSWSHGHHKIRDHAKECYHCTVELVINVIGQEFDNGKLLLKVRVVEFLKKKGLFQVANDTQNTS